MASPELASKRFRGFLPIVIDVETGGFHSRTDALLEIAAVIIEVDSSGRVRRGASHAFHVKPFEGSRMDPASLEVCALLTKPERRKAEVPIRYTGFEIPNRFAIGYGLDHAERWRNLPYVAALAERMTPA